MRELLPPKTEFGRRSKTPAAWISTGLSVMLAAEVLFRELRPVLRRLKRGEPYDEVQHSRGLRQRGPYALAGLAIENFLNAAILHRTPPERRRIRNSHDLVVLSNEAGIEWSATQRELLNRLTRFVTWAGRYPVALSAEETRRVPFIVASDYREIAAITTALMALHQKGRDHFA